MSLSDLSLLAKLLGVILCGVSLFLLYRLVYRWMGRGSIISRFPVSHLPNLVEVEPKIFMTKAEAALFNLVYLAVQDNFLVFPKVSLRNILKMSPMDQASRKMALRMAQKFYADMVLVHPGTRSPQTVILVSGPECDYQDPDGDKDLLEALFHKAGIEVIRLEGTRTYSVPELTAILGLEEDK